MSSAEPRPSASPSLRAFALECIVYSLAQGRERAVDPCRYPSAWREPGACFVTLRIRGALRGCTGSLEALHPLVCDVARNAYRSAFCDPRFPALSPEELPEIEIKVAVLSAPQPFEVSSEDELLARLRPGVDGLVLREGPHAATFLPAVWESLPEPRAFLDALREKAGLPRGHWSLALRFERYTTSDAD
jgi:AmmeMemoRadiSam system protein A